MAKHLTPIPGMSERTLFSDKAIRDYFANAIAESPSLNQLPAEIVSCIVESTVALVGSFRSVFVRALVVLAIIESIIWRIKPSLKYYGWIIEGIILAFILIIILIIAYYERGYYAERAVLWLFDAILVLEFNSDVWGQPALRDDMLRQIKKIAKAVEDIPSQFRYMTTEVRRDIFRESRRKAQAMRHLQRGSYAGAVHLHGSYSTFNWRYATNCDRKVA